jgi:hypothetical protein
MQHPRLILGMVVGLLVGSAIVMASVAPAPQVSALKVAWPPRPEEIVNVHWGNLGLPQVPVGTPAVVYSVPADRWLVITQASVRAGCDMDLCEDLGGSLTVKRRYPATSNPFLEVDPSNAGPLGWAFKPGSNVVVRNSGSGGSNCALPSGSVVVVSLIGYLAH